MELEYNRFFEITKDLPRRLYSGESLPKGGIRLFARDSKNIEHTIVLTKEEFVKEFGTQGYMNVIQGF